MARRSRAKTGAFVVASAASGSTEPLTLQRRPAHDARVGRRRALGDQRRRQRGGVRDDRGLGPRRPARTPRNRPPRPARSRCATSPAPKRSSSACDRAETGGPVSGTEAGASVRGGVPRADSRGSSRRRHTAMGAESPAGSLDQRRRLDGGLDGREHRRAGADAPRRSRRATLHRAAVAADRARLGNADRAGHRRLGPGNRGLPGQRRARAATAQRQRPPTRARGRSSSTSGVERSSTGIWPIEGGTSGGQGDFVPRLSADGYEVAFISGALPETRRRKLQRLAQLGEQADLYVRGHAPRAHPRSGAAGR